MEKLKALYSRLFNHADCLQNFSLLLARVSVGWVFIESGWGKLHNLEKVAEFFVSLGIPLAQIQAPFVATTEFVCGLLVTIGLFTRLATLPLIPVMAVAIITAKREEIEGISSLFGFSEYLYIALLVTTLAYGAGKFSIDRALKLK